MTNKFNFTADELNAILGHDDKGVKHSDRYNRLREKFGYMCDEQFDEVYSTFYEGSTGIIRTQECVSEYEAKAINVILNALTYYDLPQSFSDVYYKNATKMNLYDSFGFQRSNDVRNRLQRLVDTLEEKGAIEGLRVIRIMTQGTCHIKLYEIR